ncbi:MAG: hypothetical protein K6G87_08190 [Butyrivibrio sp.]|uniref:hypothetical protein n=1 Tax=Butyrivibrio sp. TaxID=28121 RepID=UPI0025E2A953|nr:hypothetical protein [Butyrivibrio sp.]MCR5771192.1 hypothetical protein [Butyrivibrio sp.]
MDADFSELARLRLTVVEIGTYTWRKKAYLKEKIKDGEIYPNLYYTPKDYISRFFISLKGEQKIYIKVLSAFQECNHMRCNTANLTNHIYDIIHRIQIFISTNYEYANFYEKKEIVALLSFLQQSFI